MKSWIKKLVEQFEIETDKDESQVHPDLNEDRATILYMIDTYNKNLFEVEERPIRKIREMMDEFSKQLMSPDKIRDEKLLFELRQFFSGDLHISSAWIDPEKTKKKIKKLAIRFMIR